MNPFLNPIKVVPFIKNRIFDPGRIKRQSPKKIKKYRDEALRRIVKYAYNVPLYQKKYKQHGLRPDDIEGIDDIVKLPFVTKQDIIKNFPDGLLPRGYNKKEAYKTSTSGSSGEKINFYVDFPTIAKCSGITFRIFQNLNLHWRKSRYALILNFNLGTINNIDDKAFISHVRSIFSLKNQLLINVFDPITEIIEKLNNFDPEMIVSYPNVFQRLAFYKRKGYAKNINPEFLLVGGYVLDEYSKRYIEDSFRCKILNLYGSAEASADIAVECLKGKWHINYDFFHIEAIDKDGNIVDPGEKGKIVLTRLYGRGTPFIRYTGMDDKIILEPDYRCDCGLQTPIIKKGIEGKSHILLPDGKFLDFNSYKIIPNILNDLDTLKVKQFQIVQTEFDKIEIHLIIDNDLKGIGPSVDHIFERIKEEFEKKVASQVKIIVKEVNKTISTQIKPTPLVISKIKN